MPTHKTKKHKAHKVKVKTEPMEIKPLSEFVDDRLELIKQAFSCLKPKTIKTITPKYLQNKSLEAIQEQCLDEVLGISKKRLFAIINATKCPTDTESSSDNDDDDGKDSPKVIEHISLDEISSEDEPKGGKKSAKNKSKPEEPPKKEYSVLELLELQARARAIRSQLALEPVTKIELDDDNKEGSKPEDVKATTKETRTKKLPSTNDKKLENGNNKAGPSKEPVKAVAAVADAPKKVIKLKRNFRKYSETQQEDPPQVPKKEPEAPPIRGSSPEVMTILASPETLCISSDEESRVKRVAAESKIEEAKPKDVPEEGEIDDEEVKEDKCVTEDVIEAPTEVVVADTESKDCGESELKECAEKDPTETPIEEVLPVATAEQEPVVNYDHQNDEDYIELDCNEPLEDEPEQLPDVDVEVIPAKDETVEILDSSSASDGEQEQESAEKPEDSNDSKTWGQRWLDSGKVAQILALSKLGNTLRRNIKRSKLQQREANATTDENEKLAVPPPTEERPPMDENIEVGSVNHYQNIVEKQTSAEDNAD